MASVPFEQTRLYSLIRSANEKAYKQALNIIDSMQPAELQLQSENTGNTFLHELINTLDFLSRNTVKSRPGTEFGSFSSIRSAIPVIYRLAIRDVDINACNRDGNTALHLAAFRPLGDLVVQHLIRLGIDPGLENKEGYRVIHENETHTGWYVLGERKARSGIWLAVLNEDLGAIDKYLRSWCRVDVRHGRRSLLDVAYDTGSYEVVGLLEKHRATNELVARALALDLQGTRELLTRRVDRPDVRTCDESERIRKPLFADVKSLGPIANDMLALFKSQGVPDDSEYLNQLKTAETMFEDSEFFKCVEECTEESLERAWSLVDECCSAQRLASSLSGTSGGNGGGDRTPRAENASVRSATSSLSAAEMAARFYVNAVSQRSETAGWSYLHLLVNKYLSITVELQEPEQELLTPLVEDDGVGGSAAGSPRKSLAPKVAGGKRPGASSATGHDSSRRPSGAVTGSDRRPSAQPSQIGAAATPAPQVPQTAGGGGEGLRKRRRLVRLMYKLALEGLNVHQTTAFGGETALTFAKRKGADRLLLDHLIRIGVDSSITTKDKYAVVFNMYATRGDLVLDIANRPTSLPGLWPAVVAGDVARVRYWLESQARVLVTQRGRTPLDYARDADSPPMPQVVQLLEAFVHQNEFAFAVLACDRKRMIHYLSLGNGARKVNARNEHYFAGYRDDWKVDLVSRPLVMDALEYATPEVVQFLIEFGAKLDSHESVYDLAHPCGPAALWAFRDHVESEVTYVVARNANLRARDECGATMLHRAVMKNDQTPLKLKIIQTLLDRGASVADCDIDGQTPRDYTYRRGCAQKLTVRQLIDDHVLEAAQHGHNDVLERLIVDGYENLLSIRGTPKNKTAMELATTRNHKEVIELLNDYDKYKDLITSLHRAVVLGDVKTFLRYLFERKAAYAVDKRGRNILHLAVLFERLELVSAIVEQFLGLISKPDSLLRTPIHYAMCFEDRRIMSKLTSAAAYDNNMREANNFSFIDYYNYLEHPVAAKKRPRGRRELCYDPRTLIEVEREATYRLLKMDPLEMPPLRLHTSVSSSNAGDANKASGNKAQESPAAAPSPKSSSMKTQSPDESIRMRATAESAGAFSEDAAGLQETPSARDVPLAATE